MDKKYNEIQLCKKNEFNYQIEITRLESKVKDLEQSNKNLLTKDESWYNDIEYPNLSLKDLEISLKLSDKYTIKTIRSYLVNDSYEIVKNMAKVINSWNASEIIAYRDWALQRNESLIKMFDKIIKESEKPMHDKTIWKQL